MLVQFSILNYRTYHNSAYLVNYDEDCITLPVTLIYGANASGKSNFIDALSLAKSLVCGDVTQINETDLAYNGKEMLFSGKVEINGDDRVWSVRATAENIVRNAQDTEEWFRTKLSVFDPLAPTPPISIEMDDLLTHLNIDTSRGETDGSRRLRRLLPWIMDALAHGKTLVVDDFDLHIHPVLASYFVRVFQDNETGSQLIVTTHNASLIHCVTRADVWVVEQSRNNESELISLLEYRLDDDVPMRDVEHLYITSKFEGVPYISSETLDLLTKGAGL